MLPERVGARKRSLRVRLNRSKGRSEAVDNLWANAVSSVRQCTGKSEIISNISFKINNLERFYGIIGACATKELKMLKTLKSHYVSSTIGHIVARTRDLGLIHQAKAQLGLADGAYAAMVSSASRGASESSADLDARERARLLRAMAKLGYAPTEPSEKTIERSQKRREELAAIHVAKSQIGIADGAYRDLVEKASHGKARTSALLNAHERQSLMAAIEDKAEA
jgi:hypothetical protein